jgi:hypothetical protein
MAQSTVLSAEEQALESKLGYPHSVFQLLKAKLNPQLGTVTQGDPTETERDFFEEGREEYRAPLLEIDKQTFIETAKSFPELKPVIDQQLSLYGGNFKERMAKSAENAKVVGQILANMNQRALPGKGLPSFAAPGASPGLPDFAKMSNMAGIDLSNLPDMSSLASLLHLNMPDTDRQADAPKPAPNLCLALKFKGLGDNNYSSDPRILPLREELRKLGYNITEERDRSKSEMFLTRKAAENYLQEAGTPEEKLNLSVQEAKKIVVIYPVDRLLRSFSPLVLRG